MIICVVMLFVVPTVIGYQRQDMMIYNMVQTEVTSFSEKVREIGYIDQGMINDFYGKLHSSGLDYDISLEHLSKSFADDGGNMKAYYDGTYSEDIIAEMNINGRYEMVVGDFFYIRVESTSFTKSQVFYNLIGVDAKGPGIYVTSGGMVRYSDS